MEDKKEIIMRLKLLLKATRAGSTVADLILNKEQDKVVILFRTGFTCEVNIETDSGIEVVKDVLKYL